MKRDKRACIDNCSTIHLVNIPEIKQNRGNASSVSLDAVL
jgi:hypothetical protein